MSTEIRRDGSARLSVAESPTEYILAATSRWGRRYFRVIFRGSGSILQKIRYTTRVSTCPIPVA